jgi:hypothetical protein
MTTLTNEEKAALLNCQNEAEYGRVAHKIKKDHGNEYPSDWWSAVMLPGGISDTLKKRWNNPTAFDLHISFPSEEDLRNGKL